LGGNKEIAVRMINGASDNTANTARFVRPNFGFTKTSYMLRTLSEIEGKETDQNVEDKIWYR